MSRKPNLGLNLYDKTEAFDLDIHVAEILELLLVDVVVRRLMIR